MIHDRLPLEFSRRPVRTGDISTQEVVETWISYYQNNLPQLLWVIARLYYLKQHLVWYRFTITHKLSRTMKIRIGTALRRIAYKEGFDQSTFSVIITAKDGVYFAWLKKPNLALVERRKAERRKRHPQKLGTEGCPVPSDNAAPPEIIDDEPPPSLPVYMRPSRTS